ncbi:hypothetical protein ACFQY4_25675 [Catellatospora bangladeshensis]|uniref:hypothetical protein n=1 Tax=Catellatospora bangladeshensis TaxID=310355 RepID=UPI00360AD959
MGDAVSAVYVEAAAQDRVAELPLAHLSIELGHLYMEDYIAGPARLRETFEQVAPWVRTAMAVCGAGVAPRTARISTCFLVDDYFTRPDVAGGWPAAICPGRRGRSSRSCYSRPSRPA